MHRDEHQMKAGTIQSLIKLDKTNNFHIYSPSHSIESNTLLSNENFSTYEKLTNFQGINSS